jgi:hypothetical protein
MMPQFENNHCTQMCRGNEAGSYLRLIHSCITQLKIQGPSRTCDESTEEKEEEEEEGWVSGKLEKPGPLPRGI